MVGGSSAVEARYDDDTDLVSADSRERISAWRKALNCFWGNGAGSVKKAPFLDRPAHTY